MDKARRLLSDGNFAAFRQASSEFMAGSMDATELHRRTEALGAAALVPDVAALCPDPNKRRQLLAAYRAAAQSGTHSNVRHHVPCALDSMFRTPSADEEGRRRDQVGDCHAQSCHYEQDP